MISIALYLLRARQIATRALAWVFGNPTRILASVLALALLWGLYERHRADVATQALTTCKSTHMAAVEAAEEAKAKAEADYRSKANAADVSYRAGLAAGDARLSDYIAAHRVQPAPKAPAPSTPENHNPAVPAITPATTIVEALTISEADLRTCDTNYTYARAAYDWAMSMERNEP